MTARRTARRVFSALFVVVAFAFLGTYVARNLEQLRAFPWTLRPGLLGLSLLLNVVALAWGVWVWMLLLRRVGVRIPFPALARVWFLSALGRYIPGKIWQFVGAAHLGASVGLSPVVAVTSLAVHTGFFVVGAVLAALFFLPPQVGDLGGIGLPQLRWAAPLLLLTVHPAVIGRALGWFHRLARRPVAAWEGSWGDGVGLLALALAAWVLNGLALYLFLASLVPLSAPAALWMVGINALAFLVGLAVFVAPAGLGAKEGALAALLALVGPPIAVAALLAVAARLWSVATEVAPALVLLGRPGSGAGAAPDGAATPSR